MATKMLVNHSRKGKFVAMVPDLDNADEWVDVEVVEGEAVFITEENAVKGDTITVRKSLCTFKPLP